MNEDKNMGNDGVASPKNLSVPIGLTASGLQLDLDLEIAQHVLIAGNTGSGKSTVLHSFINWLIHKETPETLRFALFDPKLVEMTLYDTLPQLYTQVVTDSHVADEVFSKLKLEMDERLTSDSHDDTLSPKVLVIADEFSDFMCSEYAKSIEENVLALATHGHTVGIHLILSTSRPSTEIFTEKICKAFPSRIVGSLNNQFDSMALLGTSGAELLGGRGDMLLKTPNFNECVHFHAYNISTDVVKENVSALESTQKKAEEYDILSNKIFEVPIDKINVGKVDMETYNSSESYIHIFKCKNRECRLEFMVLSWSEKWPEKFVPYCPECGHQNSINLRQRFVPRRIYEIVSDPYLGQE